MRQIINPFAGYERAVIEAQYESRPEAVRARGERAGAIPFGYRVAADGVKLEAAAEEQCIIAAVSGLRAAGYTLRAISQELNGRGVHHAPWPASR